MKFRLKSAHYLPGDKWLPGDLENQQYGEERGTIVGDGTDHPIVSPTIEMVPLDEEAEKALAKEELRLSVNQTSMTPLDKLPLNMDTYEERYIPGYNARRKGA